MLGLKTPILKSRLEDYLRHEFVAPSCVLAYPGLDYGNWYTNTIKDYSGQNNHGTITGASWTRLSSGLWGLKYNGASLVNVGTDPLYENSGTEMTFSVWIYVDPADFNGTFVVLADAGNLSVGSGWSFILDDRGGAQPVEGITAFVKTATGAAEWISSNDNVISTAGFYRLTITYNKTTGQLLIYVNGVDQTGTVIQDGSGNFVPVNANLILGRRRDTATFFFTGQMYLVDELTRYTPVAEDLANYQQTRYLFGV